HPVDVGGANTADSIALLPRRTKPVGVIAAAKEAWPMSARQGRGLVEEEQFGPALRRHHLAAAAAEIAQADQPCLARPALPQQRPRRGIMDDAAIASEQAAVRRGDNLACRRDTVLQRHRLLRLRLRSGK